MPFVVPTLDQFEKINHGIATFFDYLWFLFDNPKTAYREASMLPQLERDWGKDVEQLQREYALSTVPTNKYWLFTDPDLETGSYLYWLERENTMRDNQRWCLQNDFDGRAELWNMMNAFEDPYYLPDVIVLTSGRMADSSLLDDSAYGEGTIVGGENHHKTVFVSSCKTNDGTYTIDATLADGSIVVATGNIANATTVEARNRRRTTARAIRQEAEAEYRRPYNRHDWRSVRFYTQGRAIMHIFGVDNE